MPEITKDIIIADLLKAMPQSASILQNCGMRCVYCPSSLNETLEEACMVHGLDCETMLDELNAERELTASES